MPVANGHISGVVHVTVVAHPVLQAVEQGSAAVSVDVTGHERVGQGIVEVWISMHWIFMQERVGQEAVG